MKIALFSLALGALALVHAEPIPGAKHYPKPTCTTTVKPPPPTSTTTPPASSTSLPPSCVNTPGSTVRVTKTLAFEDIDSTVASRVPIPDGYNGFSHSDPNDNKIYMAGDPPVSVSPKNVLYANRGSIAFGAVGFPWNPQYFHVLTFLDGITYARVRVSGVLVQPFEQRIDADRQFVRIDLPPFDRITAVNLLIEVFGEDSTTNRLAFWLDDLVYVRREWQITCCQYNNPNRIQKLKFDDIRRGAAPRNYNGFTLSPRNELSIVDAPTNNPSKPNSLYKKASANPVTLDYQQGVFNLLSFTLTISQYSQPPFTTKQTRILVTGFNPTGSQIGSWDIPASTYQPGTYSIHLGGDWMRGNTGGLYINGRTGGGGHSGLFSSGGFRSVKTVKVQVLEEDYSGNGGQTVSSIPKAFWIDDFEYQKPAGCEEDF